MARCSVVGVQVKDTWGLPSEGLVARSKGARHRGLWHTGLGQRRPAGEPTCLTEKAPPCPWNGEPGFLPLSRWPWLNHLSFLDLGLLPAVWNDSHGAGLSRGWLVGRTVHREAPCVCGEPALHLATGNPALAHCPLWRAGRQPHTRTPPASPTPHPCRRTGVDSLTGTGGPGAVSAGNVSLSAAGMETSCLLPQADSHKCTKEDRAARHQDTRGCGGVSQGSRRSHAECLSQTGFLSDPGE